jgi:hypothetical protein
MRVSRIFNPLIYSPKCQEKGPSSSAGISAETLVPRNRLEGEDEMMKIRSF